MALRPAVLVLTTGAVAAATLITPAAPAEAATPYSWSRSPAHYSVQGAHLRPGETEPTQDYYRGERWARTVTYVVGDSMAGQIATPVYMAHRSWKTKPRTKSGTAFRLGGGGATESDRYSAAVLEQMQQDKRHGRRVIAVIATQDNNTIQWRQTIWRLRKNGIAVRLVTSTPQANPVNRAGDNYTIASRGIGRWATLKAAEYTNIPVLDMFPVVARPVGGGKYRGTVNGTVVQRSGSHVTNDFANRYMTGPIGTVVR